MLISLVVIMAMLVFNGVDRCAHAWTCAPEHPQSTFCRAQFVVKAEVSSTHDQQTNPMISMLGYKAINVRLTLIKIFKGEQLLSRDLPNKNTKMEGAIVTIRTFLHTHSEWEKGGVYLLTGTGAKEGKDYVGLVTQCDWIQPWDDVTNVQYQGLVGYYSNHCGCLVKRCVGGVGGECQRGNVCKWDIRKGGMNGAIKKRDCMSQVAVCLGVKETRDEKEGLNCSWHVTQLKCKIYQQEEEAEEP